MLILLIARLFADENDGCGTGALAHDHLRGMRVESATAASLRGLPQARERRMAGKILDCARNRQSRHADESARRWPNCARFFRKLKPRPRVRPGRSVKNPPYVWRFSSKTCRWWPRSWPRA